MRLLLPIIFAFFMLASAVTWLYHYTQKSDINYYQGHGFFEKGEYDNAKERYLEVLTVNPRHKGALRDLAYSYQWTGDFQRAAEVFGRLISIEPKNHEAMIAFAEALAWNKEYDRSIAVCEKIVEATGNAKAQLLLGQVYLWDKQFLKAKKVLEEVLAKFPDNRQAKLLYAKVLHYSGEIQKAIESYQELLKEKGESEDK